MYGSMWRLTVYVAPEHLDRYEEIVKASGQVVFETVDLHRQFEGKDIPWSNDEHLQNELKAKLGFGESAPAPNDFELSPLGAWMGQLGERLLESGRLSNVPSDLLGRPDGIPTAAREEIEKALVAALELEARTPGTDATKEIPVERVEILLQQLRTHSKRVKRTDIDKFRYSYTHPLARLPREAFEDVVTQMQGAILRTGELDQQGAQGATVHKGTRFDQFRDALDELLRKHGVAPLPVGKGQLFGESN